MVSKFGDTLSRIGTFEQNQKADIVKSMKKSQLAYDRFKDQAISLKGQVASLNVQLAKWFQQIPKTESLAETISKVLQ